MPNISGDIALSYIVHSCFIFSHFDISYEKLVGSSWPPPTSICVSDSKWCINIFATSFHCVDLGKGASVSFMYVCVAENAELFVFFTFFLHLPYRQYSFRREGKPTKIFHVRLEGRVKVLVFRECMYV